MDKSKLDRQALRGQSRTARRLIRLVQILGGSQAAQNSCVPEMTCADSIAILMPKVFGHRVTSIGANTAWWENKKKPCRAYLFRPRSSFEKSLLAKGKTASHQNKQMVNSFVGLATTACRNPRQEDSLAFCSHLARAC